MFLSREIDIKLCQIYTKIHKYTILYKSSRYKQIIFHKYEINLNFGIVLTQFYINLSRQKHQIDILYVSFNVWDPQFPSYTLFHFSFTVPLSATNDFPEKLASMKFNESYTRLLKKDFKTDQNWSNMEIVTHHLKKCFCILPTFVYSYIKNWFACLKLYFQTQNEWT